MSDQQDTPQEQLTSYFTRSASSVHLYADRFEHQYARPAINTSNAFFTEHPVFSIFIASFSFLSLLPIALFIVLSASAILTFTILAICFIIASSITTLVFFVSVLACTLVTIFCFSVFVTGSLFIAYTLYRLISLTRTYGFRGINIWGSEIVSYIWPLRIPSIPSSSRQRPRNTATVHKHEQAATTDHASSSTSNYDNDDKKPRLSDESHTSSNSTHSQSASGASDGPVIVDEKDTEFSDHSRQSSSAGSGDAIGESVKVEE
ncbi:hypothetical protein K435DRAFT_775424 [Dendrothele bispora CBS 962.96]|uniref:Uncharacterized protein n=1 Tax=Dendrothele bispora (strain CBS 962.96) TaxID=1314807 RepID=A0A4V4HHG7_DENBC|nr:hypothetical protein K435DRAFT_775424 [Dendrothele bispora CBS 962.96]